MASYTLGLDLGSASIGWAIVHADERIVDCGVRIFDPGVNLEEFTKGIEGSSNNTNRRTARLHRRQLRRRAARQRDLFILLQEHGLLPPVSPRPGGLERHGILERLDANLRSRWRKRLEEAGIPEQSLIYLLRRSALAGRLEAEELGRVLYHLSQRRGFKSNRRDEARLAEAEIAKKKSEKAEELGKVKAGIEQLSEAMRRSEAPTLGAYLASLSAERQRVRGRWTDRRMFVEEFEAIWNAQAAYHPQLTPELKCRVYELLYFQRPIARNDDLIGFCELELKERRAPMASLTAQRFRLLQKVNDLEYQDGFATTPLNPEQRAVLEEKLESGGDLKFDFIRQLLGLKKAVKFNLERGGEKKLPGNRTHAAMLRVLPDLWPHVSPEERDSIVSLCREADEDEQLLQRLMAECGLAEDDARALCSVRLEDGYHSLSLKAMERLGPLMESGVRFKTAEDQIYGNSFSGNKIFGLLPPVEDVLPQIPNPAVMRALTELRKVVNALIREHGKPAEVRVELARELKRNARQRENEWKLMRGRQSEREKARKRILEEAHRPEPSGVEIQKALLFEECGGTCVYCGKSISFQQLFDGNIHRDHILPKSRFPDDSFANRVLACNECNQQKSGRTPFEAFGGDEGQWQQILGRVEKWRNAEKVQRFQVSEKTNDLDKELDPDSPESFAARRLNDTRYTSKLAARYLGSLYGGRDLRQPDGSTRRVIFASSGMLTATLRKEWGLEAILREPAPAESSRKPGKPRGDHRHHAIDAIVIALSSNAAIQKFSAAAGAGNAITHVAERIPPPWQDFVGSIRPRIENMVVSHRPVHKLYGPLHDETNYSAPREILASNGKKKPQLKTVVHIRKPVHTLSLKQIEAIVDPTVQKAVRAKLQEVGNEPKKLENNWPMLRTHTGKEVPIRRVRVCTAAKVQEIAKGEKARYVALNSNHHVALFATNDKKGHLVWDAPEVVSRYEALRRRQCNEPIVQKILPADSRSEFLFALMRGDMVEMQDPELSGRNFYVVQKMSQYSDGRIEVAFARHTDARKADLKAERITRLNELLERNCRKLFVDVLGRIRT